MNGQTDVPSCEGISKNRLSSASLTALRAKAITVLHAQGWSQHHIAQVLQLSQPAIFKHLQKVPPMEAHSTPPVSAAQPVSEGDNLPDALPPVDQGVGDNRPDPVPPAATPSVAPQPAGDTLTLTGTEEITELMLILCRRGVLFTPDGSRLIMEVPEDLPPALRQTLAHRGRDLHALLEAVRTESPPCPTCQGRVFWEACAFCQPPPTALGVQLIWRRGAP